MRRILILLIALAACGLAQPVRPGYAQQDTTCEAQMAANVGQVLQHSIRPIPIPPP